MPTWYRLVGRGGRPARELAVRLDLLGSLGPREAWRRARYEARAAGAPRGLRAGYHEIWWEAAAEVGAEATDLGDGFVEFALGERRSRVWNSWVPLDDVVTLRLAGDKLRATDLLRTAGLPVPAHAVFTRDDLTAGLQMLEREPGPVFVKPAAAAGGSGATGGIRSSAALHRATLRAGRIGEQLLIQRQMPGDLYRLLILDSELVDVVRRRPPTVVGDGRSTVAQLVADENDRRLGAGRGEGAGLLRLDLDAVLTLESSGLSTSSVPAAGQRVLVKTVVNQNSRGDNESAMGEVCDDLCRQAVRAADAIGVRLAGVDVITPDATKSLEETGGVILEVNGTPGLHYHYQVRDPDRATRVAVPILKRILA